MTSLTQIPSQEDAQQKGSAVQICWTQLGTTGGSSHAEASAGPCEQAPCVHVPWLAEQERLPQIVRTSSTQMPSQKVSQQ